MSRARQGLRRGKADLTKPSPSSRGANRAASVTDGTLPAAAARFTHMPAQSWNLPKTMRPVAASAVMQQFKARFPAATAAKVGDDGFQAADQYLGRLVVFRNGRYIGGYAIPAGGPDPMTLSTELAAKIR